MRLLEAIIDANNRAQAGDANAGLQPDEYATELPLVALTCIDPRLNPFFPDVLGLPKEQFIWLRNAGNIITNPLSSTMRSLALACAIKGGKEIAIIGHTDCQVCKTSTLKLTEAFKAIGIDRAALPENLTEFFGMFASERQNVIKAVEFTRRSPIIGPRIPVHGLMVDINTGKLEWVVNGYQSLEMQITQSVKAELGRVVEGAEDAFKSLGDFKFGEMKFPENKIGEVAQKFGIPIPTPPPTAPPAASPAPPQTAQPPPPRPTPSDDITPIGPLPFVPPPIAPTKPPQPPPPRRIPVPPPVRPIFRLPRDK